MEKSPFTFDKQNPRWVTNAETPSKVYFAAGALFLYSMSLYNRRYFRVNNNLVNMMAFTALSAPSSYVYANFFFNSAGNEAACINNTREMSS